MRLYAGTSKQFIQDTTFNQIAGKLKDAFFQFYRYNPSLSEINSWNNSLSKIKDVIVVSDLTDHGVILEYQLPQTSKRLDFLVTGNDPSGKPNAVIVELKQWSRTEPSDGENEVRTFVGGNIRDVLHPSAQVGQYRNYLGDCHTAFYEGDDPVDLHSCSYLHNYTFVADDAILDAKFNGILTESPVFTSDDVERLSGYLVGRLAQGEGMAILNRIEQSKYRPSKKLMEHVAGVIAGVPEYVLLDEQLVVFDKVMAAVRRGHRSRKKHAVLVKGGPGTGKSVIAINLMATLLREEFGAQYATGSRAFTETLRKVIGRRGSSQFKYFKNYVEAQTNEIDVIIADEAHRLRDITFDRYRPHLKSGMKQIEEILNAAKVSVFLLDDHQVIRPDEVGSVSYIKEVVAAKNIQLDEFELETQFRCAGSEGFVNWVSNTLGTKETANVLWTGEEEFDFRVVGSPHELDHLIRKRLSDGFTARLMAGYCWTWSKETNPDGSLVDDVVIGDFARPWNARPETKNPKAGIPTSDLWAYDSGGVNQIGCGYTAQGFEWDYAGVIVGSDLVYDLDEQRWVGKIENSKDPELRRRGKDQFTDLVKNVYRVLLSRGMKGCYVYFVDKDTERFFKSRMVPRVQASTEPVGTGA